MDAEFAAFEAEMQMLAKTAVPAAEKALAGVKEEKKAKPAVSASSSSAAAAPGKQMKPRVSHSR